MTIFSKRAAEAYPDDEAFSNAQEYGRLTPTKTFSVGDSQEIVNLYQPNEKAVFFQVTPAYKPTGKFEFGPIERGTNQTFIDSVRILWGNENPNQLKEEKEKLRAWANNIEDGTRTLINMALYERQVRKYNSAETPADKNSALSKVLFARNVGEVGDIFEYGISLETLRDTVEFAGVVRAAILDCMMEDGFKFDGTKIKGDRTTIETNSQRILEGFDWVLMRDLRHEVAKQQNWQDLDPSIKQRHPYLLNAIVDLQNIMGTKTPDAEQVRQKMNIIMNVVSGIYQDDKTWKAKESHWGEDKDLTVAIFPHLPGRQDEYSFREGTGNEVLELRQAKPVSGVSNRAYAAVLEKIEANPKYVITQEEAKQIMAEAHNYFANDKPNSDLKAGDASLKAVREERKKQEAYAKGTLKRWAEEQPIRSGDAVKIKKMLDKIYDENLAKEYPGLHQ